MTYLGKSFKVLNQDQDMTKLYLTLYIDNSLTLETFVQKHSFLWQTTCNSKKRGRISQPLYI